MKKSTLIIACLAVAFAAVPMAYGQDSYLGKPMVFWHQDLKAAPDAKAKRNAAFALGKLGTQSTPALQDLGRIAQLSNEDASAREAAIVAIGQIVPKARAGGDIVQVLCKLATDPSDERLRRSAVVAIGSCCPDSPEARRTLESALTNGSAAVRQNAAWALGEICHRAGTAPATSLKAALKDSDKLVRRDAALGIGKIVAHRLGDDAERQRLTAVREQCREALPELLDCVRDDYLELKKAACMALISLVSTKDDYAIPVLKEVCQQAQDPEIRRNAALALAAIGGEGAKAAVAILQEALRKGNVEVRRTAALAFRNIGPDALHALPELLEALRDSDEKVRLNTAVALGGLRNAGHAAVPALVERVVDDGEKTDVGVMAAMSLQNIGHCQEAVKAIPFLVGVFSDQRQPAKVRERVLWALRVHNDDLVKHPEAVAALKGVLSEPGLRNPASGGKMVRFDSAYLLGIYLNKTAPDEVFPVLLDFLKDPKILVFSGLRTGSGGLGEARTGDTSVAEQGTQDGRIMAVQALHRIGPDRVRNQSEIIEQLRALRDSNDQPLREAVTKLLAACGK